MKMALLVIAAGALLGGAAQAKDDPNQIQPTKAVAAGDSTDGVTKVLYVCSEDEQAWRAFSRDLGSPDFVTAKEVLADKGKSWAEPKCITPSQLHRLTKLADSSAR